MLTPEVEFQVRRVAAAFKVEEWEAEGYTTVAGDFYRIKVGGYLDGENKAIAFEAKFTEEGDLFSISLDNPNLDFLQVSRAAITNDAWEIFSYEDGDFDLMAFGLLRLGLDHVVSRFEHSLTAHEQLEARLTMPREFWPQKWLDELQNMPAIDAEAS